MDEQGELTALYVSSIKRVMQLTKPGVTSTSEVDTSNLDNRIVLPNALLLSYNRDAYVMLHLAYVTPHAKKCHVRGEALTQPCCPARRLATILSTSIIHIHLKYCSWDSRQGHHYPDVSCEGGSSLPHTSD
jgi:hypothetical protein